MSVGRRLRAVVAYDGSAYAGYQIQPDRPTVQAALEAALRRIIGDPVRVFCSGRTDTGVHARGQVIHFDVARPLAPDKLRIGLNALLPDDVRVLRLRPAAADFDARMTATGKQYRYFIWTGEVILPDLRLYRAHVRRTLDVAAMRKAAAPLVGRHDFAAFSANPQREVHGTVRDLRRLDVRKRGHEVEIIAEADGFLYRMVRSLAGFLMRVGAGDLPPESARTILASKVRTATVPTAPAAGLFLWRVFYR